MAENHWRKERIKSSFDILFNGRCMEPCHVKHWREENRYGVVSVVKGIATDHWDVVTEDGTIEKYLSVEDLVAAGWVVD